MCIDVVDLGVEEYHLCLERQLRHFEALKLAHAAGVGHDEKLLLVEHPHVYTLGRRADTNNILRRIPGVDVVQITRGGDITYHGPGQLVAYPIIDLQLHHLGVKQYVDCLEEAVIRTIAEYGIDGRRVEGATGVWIETGTPRERKICAIGVKCSRFCTMHGLALNVNTDLSYFSAIHPCGFVDKGVTSIAAEVGHDVAMDEVKQSLSRHLLGLLGD